MPTVCEKSPSALLLQSKKIHILGKLIDFKNR